LRSGPFEGPAIVKPPALPEDTYLFLCSYFFVADPRPFYDWQCGTNRYKKISMSRLARIVAE